ncbi:hypothetical protein HPB51_010707 [Rhipicephalus microplus]|uniref:Uncharacterized protein n=1 Tax=Rhipicephalus microplus TaxID=6941 RepID=A0A9J6F123_RHIMP|nr:hypothetical protein HPB51_010707 [Rhipicephalus microplus]
MSYSSEQEAWLLRRSSKPKYTNENDYARLFRLYGVRHDEDQLRYATKILAYEEQLRQIEKDTINMTQKQFIGIYDLGEHTAPHVTGMVTPQMVEEVRQLAFRIKDVFIEAVQSSSWLLPSVRTRLFQKLKEIDVLVGSPGDQLEPKFVKRFYEALPDVPFNRLFPSWIQGRRLNTHYRWKDQKTKFYDEERVTAFFMGLNTAVIPTAQLLRPFFYEYGPSALKFGGIGTKGVGVHDQASTCRLSGTSTPADVRESPRWFTTRRTTDACTLDACPPGFDDSECA